MNHPRLFHPPLFDLERFADGDLGADKRRQVARHLAICSTCRARVNEVRQISQRLQQVPTPAPMDDLWERIDLTIRSGPRIILPGEFPIPLGPPRVSASRVALLASSVLATFVAASVALWVPGLEAGHSELSFTPTGPQEGGVLALTYRPDHLLAGEERLIVRMDIYHSNDQRLHLEVPLHREGSGEYFGEVALSGQAAYLVAAVEDVGGQRVDNNAGRLWEHLVYDTEGQPRFEGLRARVAQHLTTRMYLSLEAAQAMAVNYPGRAESWSTLRAVEGFLYGVEQGEELATRKRIDFERLERRFQEVQPLPEDIGFMVLLAHSVAGPEKVRYWEARLRNEASHTRLAVQLLLQALEERYSGEHERLLEEHERVWDDVGAMEDIAASAFRVAERGGLGGAAVVWGARWVQLREDAAIPVYLAWSRLPEARDEGVRALRQELLRLEESAATAGRAVGVSTVEHRRHGERERRRILLGLGEALIALGELEAGIESLKNAASLGWEPVAAHTAAEQILAGGDSAAALPYLARTAVDPSNSISMRAEVATLGTSIVGDDVWAAIMQEAHRRMHDIHLSEAVFERLPSEIIVEDVDGNWRDLRSLLDGRVTVVSLWYCFCEQFRTHWDRHQSLMSQLERAGVQTLTVTTRRIGVESVEESQSQRGAHFWDRNAQAMRAFRYARTPSYFVVDREGIVRYRNSDPTDLARQVYVLQAPQGATLAREP